MAFLIAALTAIPARAQDNTLDRVQNLIAAGRFTEAGSVLTQWERATASGGDATSADRARALYLHGVLSTDAKQAEEAFIGVVLSYPSSAVAPQALLRLGQGLLTSGEPLRAAAYLERLRSDYPGARERDAGLLWLARAQHAAGSAAPACTAAREAAASSDPNIRTLAEIERDRVCTAQPPARADSARASAPPPLLRNVSPAARADSTRAPRDTTRNAPPPAAAPPGQVARGDYAVQIAAFSARSGADATAARLRAQGFDARIVQIEGSALHRVRVGTFSRNLDAATLARRIRNAGFDAIVVDDVKKERS